MGLSISQGPTKKTMFTPKPSYTYEDLITCGRGELFGPGNAQLPCHPC